MSDNGLDLLGRVSTEDTGARPSLDYFETPDWMVAALLAHQPIDRECLILEPCCGDGSIVRALRKRDFQSIITNDLDPRHEASRHRDATALEFWELKTLSHVDWVITNPPFGVAFPILEQAVLLARVGVAFLLRKTFLEPTAQRGPWFAIHPPTRIVGLPRYAFRGKGSDSVACDWVIWEKQPDPSRPAIVIDHRAKARP